MAMENLKLVYADWMRSGRTNSEPIYVSARIAGVGNTIEAQTLRLGVDQIRGPAGASGMAQTPCTATWDRGVLPTDYDFFCFGIQASLWSPNVEAVVEETALDLERLVYGSRLVLNRNQIAFQLGPVANWVGPSGVSGGVALRNGAAEAVPALVGGMPLVLGAGEATSVDWIVDEDVVTIGSDEEWQLLLTFYGVRQYPARATSK